MPYARVDFIRLLLGAVSLSASIELRKHSYDILLWNVLLNISVIAPDDAYVISYGNYTVHRIFISRRARVDHNVVFFNSRVTGLIITISL